MDALEERAVLEDRAADDELHKSLRRGLPEFRTDGQDGLGFRGEIKSFFRLVIIDAVHPVAVIEEGDGSACAVREQAMKPSVQARGKSGVFLIEVDKIGGTLRRQVVPTTLEVGSGPRFGEFFPGEDQNDIPSFIR